MSDEVFNLLGVERANLGWVPPDSRDLPMEEAHDEAMASMPPFTIFGDSGADIEKAFLFDFAKAANGGTHLMPYYQETGSCVGQGAGRAIDILQAVEIIHHGEPEEFSPCFVGYHYGRGRLHSGMRGRGDGSTGSGQAKAVRDDGVVFARADGIPKPFERNAGLTWGAKVENEWSDGARIGNQWLEYGRRHLVKTTAQCRNATDVKAAICNGYPVTIASDWGGMMQPPVKDGVLLNRRADRWMHQMCVLAFWKHGTHGDIYWIQNSWGDAHGSCPSGAPVGGFWVKAEEINVIAAQGETFAYSQFDGYPAQPDLFMLI